MSESSQNKIGVRRKTRERYEQARKLTGLSMVDIADIAVTDFLENRAKKFAEARS